MNANAKETKMSRRKRAFAIAAASVALVGATATAASAYTQLAPGESKDFGTNLIGPTVICLTNTGGQYGTVTFSAPGSRAETDNIRPFQRYCKEAWWWGFDVNITNNGPTYLGAEYGSWFSF
ncbi:hypothetical protein [Arthrobacter sp. USHLN218]|uniref:hypothetical protein n=1 Tax=Arthrobacter sp. USHLN218 TaxID=3081232 RepID=UPI0030172C74